MTTQVLVVDDEALIRAGFRTLVDSAPDLEVVGEAVDGADAVRQVQKLRPDVVLLDVRMPIMDGLEATRRIVQDDPSGTARVLIVTTFDHDQHVFTALRAGASGFVLKDTPPEKLLEAIRIVASGESLLSPNVTRRLITEFVGRPEPVTTASTALATLTEREMEVLLQVAAGRSNAEIAADLLMSPATAKTHVSRLLTKLDARDRAQLVVIAYEAGVVTPGS
jgi:DNA-binding NarL/FixJ family response regulator